MDAPAALTADPAEVYDEQFVPALFAPFGRVVAAVAEFGPGARVLDVGCGTGALTVVVAERAGAGSEVIGLDPNPQMLAVARRKSGAVQWVDGRAEALPFPDRHFDAAVSQFAMMFFEDRIQALREMRRVLRPGGSLTVAVCDAVEHSPGYGRLAELLQRLFGPEVADAFRAPFMLGDAGVLRELCTSSGWARAEVVMRSAEVGFASIDALVSAERACVWTLGGLLDDAQFERLRAAARHELRPLVRPDGRVVFDLPMWLIRGRAE